MIPTMKLRFVEREFKVLVDGYASGDGFEIVRKVKRNILQQWFEDHSVALAVHRTDWQGNSLPPLSKGEWRDVPVETEETK